MAVGQEPRTVTDRVIRWVTRNLGQRPPTLEIIAGDLGLTRRTLQRRLSEEGTSLRRILEHRRRDIVEGYLANPDLDMKRVAAALGYSDQTVFWRAYRRWTGARPTDRRRG